MRFFKIITYVFLIGFVIDLLGNFFSVEKTKEEFNSFNKKTNIANFVGVAATIAVYYFTSSIGWSLFTFGIGFCAMLYYTFTAPLEEEKEKESESLD